MGQIAILPSTNLLDFDNSFTVSENQDREGFQGYFSESEFSFKKKEDSEGKESETLDASLLYIASSPNLQELQKRIGSEDQTLRFLEDRVDGEAGPFWYSHNETKSPKAQEQLRMQAEPQPSILKNTADTKKMPLNGMRTLDEEPQIAKGEDCASVSTMGHKHIPELSPLKGNIIEKSLNALSVSPIHQGKEEGSWTQNIHQASSLSNLSSPERLLQPDVQGSLKSMDPPLLNTQSTLSEGGRDFNQAEQFQSKLNLSSEEMSRGIAVFKDISKSQPQSPKGSMITDLYQGKGNNFALFKKPITSVSETFQAKSTIPSLDAKDETHTLEYARSTPFLSVKFKDIELQDTQDQDIKEKLPSPHTDELHASLPIAFSQVPLDIHEAHAVLSHDKIQTDLVGLIADYFDKMREEGRSWTKLSIALGQDKKMQLLLRIQDNTIGLRFQDIPQEIDHLLLKDWPHLSKLALDKGLHLESPSFMHPKDIYS